MKYLLIAFIALVTSCDVKQADKVVYSYNGISVTRIDSDRVSYFYYGDYSNKKIDTALPYVKAIYGRGTDVMNAYLVFEADKKVRFIKMQDRFETLRNDSLIYAFDFPENIEFIHWEDSVRLKPDNVIRIDDVQTVEKEFNKKLKSKVDAKYY